MHLITFFWLILLLTISKIGMYDLLTHWLTLRLKMETKGNTSGGRIASVTKPIVDFRRKYFPVHSVIQILKNNSVKRTTFRYHNLKVLTYFRIGEQQGFNFCLIFFIIINEVIPNWKTSVRNFRFTSLKLYLWLFVI